jgi:MarR family transcriptional regulator, organic hydroperoxide resistance regulator
MKTSNSCFSQCLYFASNALARKMEKMASDCWKKVDLSPSHAYLLLMTLETPGVQPTVLSEHLQLQPSTVTRLLEKLEEKKLVIRTACGKVTNVYPTPKAKELYPKMKEIVDEFTNASLQIIGEKESCQLLESMTKMADKLSG